MELCEGGELADAIKEQGCFSEDDSKTIMTKLASAISYLHKNGKLWEQFVSQNENQS